MPKKAWQRFNMPDSALQFAKEGGFISLEVLDEPLQSGEAVPGDVEFKEKKSKKKKQRQEDADADVETERPAKPKKAKRAADDATPEKPAKKKKAAAAAAPAPAPPPAIEGDLFASLVAEMAADAKAGGYSTAGDAVLEGEPKAKKARRRSQGSATR